MINTALNFTDTIHTLRSALRRPAILAVTVVAATFALAACDEEAQPTATRLPDDVAGLDAARGGVHSDADEVYVARLTPLNAGDNGGSAHGRAVIEIEAGIGTVTLDIKGVAPNMPHLQHIHGFGFSTVEQVSVCPTQSDDADGDGLMEFAEGLPDYGGVILNLDAVLDGDGADGFLSTSDRKGTYHYVESAPLTAFPVDLASRTIVVHGIPGLPALPLVCGELQAVN